MINYSVNNVLTWKQLLALAEQGNAQALYEVGFWYDNGLEVATQEVVPINPTLAYKYYVEAHKKSYVEATLRVADFLCEGVYCKKNIPLAIQLYEFCIAKGSSLAAANLANLYRDKKEFEKAFQLYQYVYQTTKICPLELAFAYYYGIGTSKNELEGVKLFKKIAHNQDDNFPYEVDEANYMLATIYLEGRLVQKSLSKARKHLHLANRDNDHTAAQMLLLVVGK